MLGNFAEDYVKVTKKSYPQDVYIQKYNLTKFSKQS